MLTPSSSAACFCVIKRFFVLRNVTSRSLSACVISSCPSCIPQAWGCQGDISTLLKGDIITLPPQDGYLWFVSPGQINLQAPDDTTTGTVPVVVTTPTGPATSTVTLGRFDRSFTFLAT